MGIPLFFSLVNRVETSQHLSKRFPLPPGHPADPFSMPWITVRCGLVVTLDKGVWVEVTCTTSRPGI